MRTTYYAAEANLARLLQHARPSTRQIALMYRGDSNTIDMARCTATDREDYDVEFRDQAPYDQCYQIPYTSNMSDALELATKEFMHAALSEITDDTLDLTDCEGVLVYDVHSRMTYHAAQQWVTEVTRTSHTFTPRMEFAQ